MLRLEHAGIGGLAFGFEASGLRLLFGEAFRVWGRGSGFRGLASRGFWSAAGSRLSVKQYLVPT